VRTRLELFLDQALPDEESQAVEEHLIGCESCWEEMIALRELCVDLDDPYVQQIFIAEPAPLPEDFTEQVMARVAAEQPKGINLVWPWLRRKWSRGQYASVAYAMTATMMVVSVSNLLFLWNQSSTTAAVWAVKIQAYWEAVQAYLGVPADYLGSLWHGLLHLLHLA